MSNDNKFIYEQIHGVISTCEEGGVWVLGVHQDADLGDPQAEDGIVHLELSPRHGRDEVGAVFPAAAEQDLRAENNSG